MYVMNGCNVMIHVSPCVHFYNVKMHTRRHVYHHIVCALVCNDVGFAVRDRHGIDPCRLLTSRGREFATGSFGGCKFPLHLALKMTYTTFQWIIIILSIRTPIVWVFVCFCKDSPLWIKVRSLWGRYPCPHFLPNSGLWPRRVVAPGARPAGPAGPAGPLGRRPAGDAAQGPPWHRGGVWKLQQRRRIVPNAGSFQNATMCDQRITILDP